MSNRQERKKRREERQKERFIQIFNSDVYQGIANSLLGINVVQIENGKFKTIKPEDYIATSVDQLPKELKDKLLDEEFK